LAVPKALWKVANSADLMAVQKAVTWVSQMVEQLVRTKAGLLGQWMADHWVVQKDASPVVYWVDSMVRPLAAYLASLRVGLSD
jgi:hypothetical protein